MINNQKLKYYCDNKRHLVCSPYSIENLHKMAKDLNIKRCWFHKNHYDIPKRRIEEIKERCEVVNSREILDIIGGDFGSTCIVCLSKMKKVNENEFECLKEGCDGYAATFTLRMSDELEKETDQEMKKFNKR